MSRDGARLYATHYHKNSISIIDLETRGITRRVLRDAPIDVAVSPDDAFAYVTNLHSLAVIDTAANVAKAASVGALPRATAFSADGKQAYIIDFESAIHSGDRHRRQLSRRQLFSSMGIQKHWRSAPAANSSMSQTICEALLTVISTALLKPRRARARGAPVHGPCWPFRYTELQLAGCRRGAVPSMKEHAVEADVERGGNADHACRGKRRNSHHVSLKETDEATALFHAAFVTASAAIGLIARRRPSLSASAAGDRAFAHMTIPGGAQ